MGAGRPTKRKKDDAPTCSPVASDLTPLDHMLAIMNDPNADPLLRARMAVAAAPFVHSRLAGEGKKDAKKRAGQEAASSGKYATPPAPNKPKLVASR